jgi:hypothetical protein
VNFTLPRADAAVELVPARRRPPTDRAAEATQPGRPGSVALPALVTALLWCFVVLLLGLVVALGAVLRRPETCARLWCRASTLDGHPLATLVVAAVGLVAFGLLAARTRGLHRLTRRQFVALLLVALVAHVSLIGALFVLLVVVVGTVALLRALCLALLAVARRA